VRLSAKQLISLGLLGLMLIKAYVIPLLYLDYEIRRDYIVANLCENRNRPKLNCNGKCYLAKKIAEAQKQEERQAESDYMSRLLDYAISDAFHFRFLPEIVNAEISKKLHFTYSSPFAGRMAVDDIFHPPSFV
jgi:hypothetical protein